jgi:hypothetical protein
MADLIQEFFERELSEAEAGSLGDLLRESPDSALRFEGLLENHYVQTGLPLPQLPASLNSLPRVPKGIGGLGGMKLLFLLAAAGLGYLAWKYWPMKMEVPFKPEALLQAPSNLPVQSQASIEKKPVTLPLSARPQASSPTAEGEELSVVVDAPQKSLVTVRILDSAGKEVRALYTGFVEAGRWNFKWDGLLENGEAAGAGDYRIDVQTGAAHLAKDIQIKLHSASP